LIGLMPAIDRKDLILFVAKAIVNLRAGKEERV
jgi:hypothetical protein